jgi:dihydropyrimidinase
MKTAIVGGTIVTASDTYRADVLIEGEQIVAIGNDVARDADTTIDATGKLVIPGGIDVHTHLDMPFGGTTSCDNFQTGHEAALWGGTTTHVDFAIQGKGQSLQDALDTWHAKANGRAVMDYSFHMIVTDATPQVIDEMDSIVEQGVTSFKLFLAYPNVLMVDDDTLHAVMEKAADNGGLVMMHCENGQVIDRLVHQTLGRGETDPKYHYLTRPSILEGEATERAIALATLTGAPLYVVHVTCIESATAIARARAEGHDTIMGETCPQYLYLTEDDLARKGFEGAKFVCSPPLRTTSDQEHLWRAIATDDLQAVSTDHCPFRFEDQKSLGKGDFTKIPNGLPCIEERMALLSEGAYNGRLTWNRIVELTATAPARIFGMYPRKGTLAIGADADIVVWDPELEWKLDTKNLHSAVDYSCFEGMTVHGKADTVLSRGEVVLENGTLTAEPGRGHFIARERFGFEQQVTLEAATV